MRHKGNTMNADIYVLDANADEYYIGSVIAPDGVQTEEQLHDALDGLWLDWLEVRTPDNADSDFCDWLCRKLGWGKTERTAIRHTFER